MGEILTTLHKARTKVGRESIHGKAQAVQPTSDLSTARSPVTSRSSFRTMSKPYRMNRRFYKENESAI